MDKKKQWETEYAKRYMEFSEYHNRLLYHRIKQAEKERQRSEAALPFYVKLFRRIYRAVG